MTPQTRHPVIVIGAGPHGLSAAAHLRRHDIPARVFGDPMAFWRDTMPTGMLLRSSVRASSIDDPGRTHSITAWAAATGREVRFPIPRDTFLDYGRWFSEQAAGPVQNTRVELVQRRGDEFVVHLADGERLVTERVIVATGLDGFAVRPPEWTGISESLVSHSSDIVEPGRFRDRSVIVIGGGQSALETAALLHEAGAAVHAIVRRPAIFWLGSNGPVSNVRSAEVPVAPARTAPAGFRARHGLHWRESPTDVGGRFLGWVGAAPDLCHILPGPIRTPLADDCVKPAAASWLPPRLAGVRLTLGRRVLAADPGPDTITLRLDDGQRLVADHVVLGTGYRVDVRRYRLFDPALSGELRAAGGYPVLRRGLESSVRGLHFLGAPAYHSFGPVMRFVVGTAYTGPAVVQGILGHRRPLARWAF